MKIACCLTTSPRQTTYLAETAESLSVAGFDPDIFNDPDKSLGAYGNARHAIGETLSNRPDAEGVLVFQDDLRASSGLSAYMAKTLWPAPVDEIGVVSLFTPCPMREKTKQSALNTAGWWRLPLAWDEAETSKQQSDLGGLALLFPRRSAERLIANPPSPECLHGWDIRVRDFCIREGLGWWTHSPSLVLHTGRVSAIGNSWPVGWPARQAADFCENAENL